MGGGVGGRAGPQVREWALASGGGFPVAGKAGFARLADVPPGRRFRVRWARLKSVTRAVEKLFRAYDKARACVRVCVRARVRARVRAGVCVGG